MRQIVERAEGNPFFIELVAAVWAGAGPVPTELAGTSRTSAPGWVPAAVPKRLPSAAAGAWSAIGAAPRHRAR